MTCIKSKGNFLLRNKSISNSIYFILLISLQDSRIYIKNLRYSQNSFQKPVAIFVGISSVFSLGQKKIFSACPVSSYVVHQTPRVNNAIANCTLSFSVTTYADLLGSVLIDVRNGTQQEKGQKQKAPSS